MALPGRGPISQISASVGVCFLVLRAYYYLYFSLLAERSPSKQVRMIAAIIIIFFFIFSSSSSLLDSFAYDLQASCASPDESPIPHSILCVRTTPLHSESRKSISSRMCLKKTASLPRADLVAVEVVAPGDEISDEISLPPVGLHRYLAATFPVFFQSSIFIDELAE
jgi:hypothetical protein